MNKKKDKLKPFFKPCFKPCEEFEPCEVCGRVPSMTAETTCILCGRKFIICLFCASVCAECLKRRKTKKKKSQWER